LLYCKFPGECDSERILKIGQYLTKLCVDNVGLLFWPTLYRCCSYTVDFPLLYIALSDAFHNNKVNGNIKTLNVKAAFSSSWETHLRATGHHLPYGRTQCCLPPDTSECAPPCLLPISLFIWQIKTTHTELARTIHS